MARVHASSRKKYGETFSYSWNYQSLWKGTLLFLPPCLQGQKGALLHKLRWKFNSVRGANLNRAIKESGHPMGQVSITVRQGEQVTGAPYWLMASQPRSVGLTGGYRGRVFWDSRRCTVGCLEEELKVEKQRDLVELWQPHLCYVLTSST